MLRFIILAITKRPVIDPPTPQREYDIASLPSEILNNPTSQKTSASSSTSSQSVLVTNLTPHACLSSHLYPMASALPDSYLPHPLTLVSEINSTSAWTSEILASTATLIHVVLLIRAAVSPLWVFIIGIQLR